MLEVNVKDARSKLSTLLDRVEQGEEIIITRRGKKVARLVSPEKHLSLPPLKDFRSSLKIKGKAITESVIKARREERY